MLRGIVDRIEKDVVVLLFSDGNHMMIKRHHLPENLKEGSVLDVAFTLNEEAAEEQRKKVADLQQLLVERTRKDGAD